MLRLSCSSSTPETALPKAADAQPIRKTKAEQVAALPFRRDAKGKVEVMLITSRDTGRWVIPKGNPIHGLSAPDAAAREAYEEAGVIGRLEDAPIGEYRYVKRLSLGRRRPTRVTVFALAVTTQLDTWAERHQRSTRWFSADKAAALVDERDLRTLIRSFAREQVSRAAG
jgi:8-oxo-dGTP pyrophosphatase MutT (NUDIX family)